MSFSPIEKLTFSLIGVILAFVSGCSESFDDLAGCYAVDGTAAFRVGPRGNITDLSGVAIGHVELSPGENVPSYYMEPAIWYDGERVRQMTSMEHRFGLVFQDIFGAGLLISATDDLGDLTPPVRAERVAVESCLAGRE